MAHEERIAVVDALAQPALLLDEAGLVHHANPAALARFPLPREARCWAALRHRAARCADCPLPAVPAVGAPRTCRFDWDGVQLGLRLAPLGDALFLGTLAEAVPPGWLPGTEPNLVQTILDSVSDVVIATNREHLIEFVNRTFLERFGLPATALIGRSFRSVWPPLPGLEWEALAARVLDHGEVVRLHDLEYPHSVGGGSVWLNLTFSPRRDAQGTIVGAVTTVNYVTEQRRLALQLAESERRYQALFESAPVGLIIVDADRRMLVINSTAARIFDDRADLTGRRFEELVAADDRARLLAAFQRVVETGARRPEGMELAVVRPDDARRRLHVRTCDIEYQGQRCLLGAIVDVTELRELQEQLTRAERLAGLGALAAGVAHEFNNVLAAIQGRAELIADGAGAAAPLVGDCAHAIVRHSRRGAEIIAQINSLAASRPARPVALRWEDVVEDALTSLAARLAEERIEVTRDYQARGTVSADPGQVNQLVLNLLQNARDAMRSQGFGVLHVATRDLDDGVALAIGDTGPGMDEPTRYRVFEPFFTTKAGPERRGDLGIGLGLGLGLAIVHGVVRAHGGRIEVASAPGQGTRLTVVFPAALVAVDREQSDPIRVRAAGRALRVLVIDDDADVTEMIALALASRGCEATEIHDGQRAVDACVELDADLILIDRRLPPVDGLDVLREVRRRGVTTPALLLSGHRADEEPALLRELGVRRRLDKPVGLRELFAAIDEACPSVGDGGGGAARGGTGGRGGPVA